MQTFRPRAALRDRIASIAMVEGGGQEVSVLPTAGAVLGFQFCGRVRAEEGLLSTAGVTGIQEAARRYGYLGETGSILVRFTPQGATCLGAPASELTGRSVGLDELLPPARVREARERLLDARDGPQRVAVVEELVLELPWADDPIVARAVDVIGSSAGEGALVAAVARSLAMSERQLERRFLQRVGLTPKRFASLRRFERAVVLARTAPSLTCAALEAGYYDQSHMNREFRRYAGATPGDLVRAAKGVSDPSNRGPASRPMMAAERHDDDDSRHLHQRSQGDP